MDEYLAKDAKLVIKYMDTGFESVVDIFNTNSSVNIYDIELDDGKSSIFY